MALSVILVLLILAIAYFQSIHGLFSAVINAVLAIVCAALSFATYEYVAINLLSQFKPDFALGLSLVGMFIIPMAVLRALLDQLVHRACLLPMIADKVGGFAFGAVSGYVMVGMLALGLQMVPFGNGFLGFKRVDAENPTAQNELWLSPDRFAVGVGSLLSGGVMSGEKSFAALHPDLVTEIGWREAVPAEEERDRRGVRRFAPPGSISIVDGYETIDYVFLKRPGDGNTPPQYEPKGPDSGKRFLKLRFRVDLKAADEDRQHRYTPFQIRLVGERTAGEYEQYHAIAVGDSDQQEKAVYGFPARDKVDPVVNKVLAPDAESNIVAVFEVPERFTPQFVEYKGAARAPVTESTAKTPPPAVAAAPPKTPETPTPPTPTPPPAPPRTGGERVGGVRVAGSFFGDNLPVTMTDYMATDEEITNQALKQGHLRGNFADQGTQQSNPPVAKFEVPADKRLLHLNTENLRAGSTLGRALSFAVKTVQNYLVHDEAGREYKAVGVYAIAKVDGTEQIEVIYFPEQSEMSSRGLPPFSKIKDSHLQGSDYTYVFLYLIDPGAKLVRFTTGARASSAIDLREFNLVAPP